jgi:hypothetical protein
MFILLLFLVHAYIGVRLLAPFGWPVIAVGAAALAAMLALLLRSLSRRFGRRGRADVLDRTGLVAIGLFSNLFVLTLLRDAALLAAGFAASLGAPALPPAAPAASALAVPLLAVMASAWGYANARRTPSVRRVTVPIAGLPGAFNGFRIVQISDLHVGLTIHRDFVERVVDTVAGLDADVVALTGDLVDGGVPELAEHIAPLERLRARDGILAVTGNHEYYSGVDQWIDEWRRLGVRVLMNEHVVVSRAGHPLVLAGVPDHGAHHFDPGHRPDPAAALRDAPADAPRLLLAHQPRTASLAEPAGYSLQLSGHTHGGQFVPWNWFVRFQQPYTAGLHRHGSMWVYVSRGTGYWGPPKRLGAPSEITLVTLTG